jgi:asparagine synthase (glutamine-hydrolysing)
MTASTFPWMVTIGRPGGARDPFAWLSAEARETVRPQAYMERRYREALAEVPRLPGEEPVAAKRREIHYLNLTRWLSMLLERKDRMSMAAGVEMRVPFCDPLLVQYVWNVPWEMKAAGDLEKGLLRRAAGDLLPADVTQRRKSAFPVCHDPAYLAGLRDRVLEVLHDPGAPVLPLLDRPVVGAIAAARVPGVPAPAAAGLLERVLQLDAWLRYYHVATG